MPPTNRAIAAVLCIAACAAALVGGALIRQARDTASGGLGFGRLSASLQPGSIMAEREYFARLLVELRTNYVEPIDDEMALALGAVRGVVTNLNDPYAAYFDEKETAVERKREVGRYEGIGIEVAVLPSEDAEPADSLEDLSPQQASLAMRDLVVTFVAPNGPADQAGIRPGVVIESVDDRLVPSWKTTSILRHLREGFESGELTGEEFMIEMEKFTERFERTMPESRARGMLTSGSSGSVKVSWYDGDEIKSATIQKSEYKIEPIQEMEGRMLVRLASSDPADYRALRGYDELSIDLRNSGLGSAEALEAILPEILPSGEFGFVQRHPSQSATPLEITGNGDAPREINVYVDNTTTGFALILAKIVEASGRGNIIGNLNDEALWPMIFDLPNGESIRFSTGRYFVTMPRSEVASK